MATTTQEDAGLDRPVRIGYLLKPGDDEYLREMEELAEDVS